MTADFTSMRPLGGSPGSSSQRPRYRPISEYGAIGDCRTAALIAPDGSIDWCCLPHFDSPAIFCRLLDADRGGFFQLSPHEECQATASYLDGTNMLETLFTSQTGRVRLLDFMPVRPRHKQHGMVATHVLEGIAAALGLGRTRDIERDLGNDVAAAHRLTRVATVLDGETTLDLTLKATFEYARQAPVIEEVSLGDFAWGAMLHAGQRYLALMIRLDGDQLDQPPIQLRTHDDILSLSVSLHPGQRLTAMLNYARSRQEAGALLHQLQHRSVEADLDETLHYWIDWSSACRYERPYRRDVLRSALALKLCTFEPTGAIVAAPTTSLPEAIGGERNWDYRYTWLRDSSFTLRALEALGYWQEARDYFHFLHDLHLRHGRDLRIMSTIEGKTGRVLDEHELTNLEGYRGSRPVRIGNGAAEQRQMDVYGELLDAAARYLARDGFSSRHPHLRANRNVFPLIAQSANYVVEHWEEPGQGIWEMRGEPRAFVYSRVMCWVALDRACQAASGRQRQRWAIVRDRIREDILTHGYDPEHKTFVQSYGSQVLDAANLRLPLVGFLPATDERMQGTLEATLASLSGPHGLLARYRTASNPQSQSDPPAPETTVDGLSGSEGAFLVCTFWLIDDLCRQGRLDEARRRFEAILQLASPLGLFAEEIDVASGMQLGNYPQALTHIGLINAALALERGASELTGSEA